MFKKTFLLSTAALLLCFLASCSFINMADASASVSLHLSRSASSHIEYDYIEVSLQGDSTQTKRISADESTVTFDELQNGASVYIKADAYQNGEVIYTGTSETIKVNSGENTVSLTLKRIYSVIYKLNYNDEDAYYVQRIISGEYTEKPEDPAKTEEEYKFAGWFTSDDEGITLSATPFDFNTPITESITLYAKWRISSAASFEVQIDFKEAIVINVTKTVNEDEGKITFTADSGYSSYEWKWDGKVQSTNTNTLTVEMPKTPGVYRLLLIIDKESDEPHSQTMEVTIR